MLAKLCLLNGLDDFDRETHTPPLDSDGRSPGFEHLSEHERQRAVSRLQRPRVDVGGFGTGSRTRWPPLTLHYHPVGQCCYFPDGIIRMLRQQDQAADPHRSSTSVRTQIGIGSCRVSPLAKQLVNEALDANRLSAGPMMERFEQAIAELHGCRFGLMCNSGTSALHIAVAAIKERERW